MNKSLRASIEAENAQLTRDQLIVVAQEANRNSESLLGAYIFWAAFGWLGGHRFYLRQPGLGVAMFFTLGGLGIWWLIDVFLIPQRVRYLNELRTMAAISKVKVYGRG